MAERLKDLFFTKESVNNMADALLKCYPQFDKNTFISSIFDEKFETLELKEKMRHTTECLYRTLPQEYIQALDILKKAAPFIKGFEAMSLPDFVEMYGLNDWNASLAALKHFTQYASSEFAIRPFLDQNPAKGMAFMKECAEDNHENVRRFASEGCRPMLPWAMALPKFKKDPSLIFPVLEKLKDDESEFVRRSVANNLNDISKDHPDIALDVCERWFGRSQNTDDIVKHACRTLLKAGNKRALILFGFGDPDRIFVHNLKLSSNHPKIGDEIYFSFDLKVNEDKKSKVRLEYAIDYMKAGGKYSKKIFQIVEKEYTPGSYGFKRKLSLVDMTTRKHHPGEHHLRIHVNGEEKAKTFFLLK
ncbi:MAG: DNA alkylation repair protein [Candidatus Aminicenantes bacterium]|nr:DNA alkylation repair protein [Candidatus Aminicenantes bacterium]